MHDIQGCCRRTRAEFQAWAEEMASTHGYAVTFSGIGRALDEHKVLQHPSWPAGVTDTGAVTQVVPGSLLSFCLVCNSGETGSGADREMTGVCRWRSLPPRTRVCQHQEYYIEQFPAFPGPHQTSCVLTGSEQH